jgi:membrane associated rhomboid family serine protease
MRQSRSTVRPSAALIAVLTIDTAIFVLAHVLRNPGRILVHLVLIPRRALGPEPWQLVTNAFVHLRFGALLSTAIVLWFFGAPLERLLGQKRTLSLLAVATLVGSLASAGLGRAIAPEAMVTGGLPMSMAMIAAFGVAGGAQQVALFGLTRMRASTCAALFLGFTAVISLMHADWLGLAGGCAGAGVGALMGAPALEGLGARARRWSQSYKRWRIRRRYRVIPGGRDSRGILN